MSMKDKNRNWEPANARNFRNYQKDPNAVTGALFRQSEGKGLTDTQRQALRQQVGGSSGKMVTGDHITGDPNVMSDSDTQLLKQATDAYHQKQQAKKNSPVNQMKGAMGGIARGLPNRHQAAPLPGKSGPKPLYDPGFSRTPSASGDWDKKTAQKKPR